MPIKKILPTDILSESREKINANFDYLSTESNIAESIIKKYKDDLKKTVETSFEVENGKIESAINEITESIDEKVGTRVTEEVSSAITQTAEFISATVDRKITDSEGRINGTIADLRLSVDEISSSISEIEGNIPDVNSLIDGLREDLQKQIDNNIETYYMDGVPTLDNQPATDWFEGGESESEVELIYARHQGDLYFDKTSGNAYRFLKDGTGWTWKLVTDNNITDVLERLGRLESAEDGGIKVFSETPTAPYNVGDLWFQNGELKICIHPKATGDYDPEDWDYMSKYDSNYEADNNKKVNVFYGMDPLPSNYKVGDVWYDVTWPIGTNLNDSNNVYYHDTLRCQTSYNTMFAIEHWRPFNGGDENPQPFSRISQTLEGIELEVFGGDSDGNSLRSLITQTKDEINSTVEGLREDVNGELTSVRSSIDQKVEMGDVNNAITSAITTITNEIHTGDEEIKAMLNSYATNDDLNDLQEAVNVLSATIGDSDGIDIESTLSQYAKKSEVESIAGTKIENVLENKNYVISSTLDSYAKKESLEDTDGKVTTIETAVANLTAAVGDISTGLSSYATKTEVSELDKDIDNRIEEAKTEIYANLGGDDGDSDIDNVRAAVQVLTQRVGGLEEANASMTASIGDNTAAIEAMAFKDADGNVTTKLNFGADKITIDTDNFSLDEDGNVEVSGVIYATELHIGGSTAYSLDELKGEKGDTGAAGRDGVDGQDGRTPVLVTRNMLKIRVDSIENDEFLKEDFKVGSTFWGELNEDESYLCVSEEDFTFGQVYYYENGDIYSEAEGAGVIAKGSIIENGPVKYWSLNNAIIGRATGETGPQGEQGTQGERGPQGIQGLTGPSGASINWCGSSKPVLPRINDCYRNEDSGIIFIYTAGGWMPMTYDGDPGPAGADGQDGVNGMSVFITYNDSETMPSSLPTGDGNNTSTGWHTRPTEDIVWMSQKVAQSATEGTWRPAIKIRGKDGIDGSIYDDTWLTKALGETTISNGVVLSGNVLVGDADKNLTAGMSGANVTNVDDVRFFAGASNVNVETGTAEDVSEVMQSAPFRVYESGKMVATNAEISGNVLVKDFDSKITAGIIGKSNVEDADQRMYVKGFIEDGKLAFVVADADIFDSIDTDGENWWENNGEHGIDDAYIEVYYTSGTSTEKSGKTDEYGHYNFGSYDQLLYYFIIKVSKNGYKTYNAVGSIYGGVVLMTENQETKNDIRFFAGTSSTSSSLKSDIDNAPFKVYNDGTLYSTKANIGGSKTVGGYNYNTAINADEVSITAKNNTSGITNSIRIELVDMSDESIPQEVKTEYGNSGPMPQLVLTFNGDTYYLNPAMWLKGGEVDWSGTDFFTSSDRVKLNDDYRIFTNASTLTTAMENVVNNSTGSGDDESPDMQRYFVNLDYIEVNNGITGFDNEDFMINGVTGYGKIGNTRSPYMTDTYNNYTHLSTNDNYIGTFSKNNSISSSNGVWNNVKTAYADYPLNGYVKPSYIGNTIDISVEKAYEYIGNVAGLDSTYIHSLDGELILDVNPKISGFYVSSEQTYGRYKMYFDMDTALGYGHTGYVNGCVNLYECCNLLTTSDTDIENFIGIERGTFRSTGRGNEMVCLNYPLYGTTCGEIITGSPEKMMYVLVTSANFYFTPSDWTPQGGSYYRRYYASYTIDNPVTSVAASKGILTTLINKIKSGNCVVKMLRSSTQPQNNTLFDLYV